MFITVLKKQILLPLFRDEHQFHYDNNDLYKRIIDNEYKSKELFQSFETVPMLPVSGFTNFSSKTDYILDEYQDAYMLNIDRIRDFINSNSDEPIILCGFTYLIYIYLAKYCIQNNL